MLVCDVLILFGRTGSLNVHLYYSPHPCKEKLEGHIHGIVQNFWLIFIGLIIGVLNRIFCMSLSHLH